MMLQQHSRRLNSRLWALLGARSRLPAVTAGPQAHSHLLCTIGACSAEALCSDLLPAAGQSRDWSTTRLCVRSANCSLGMNSRRRDQARAVMNTNSRMARNELVATTE